METKIPGLKSGHQIITPACRANRGVEEAFAEAYLRLWETYRKYAGAPENAAVDWHLVLARDEPRTPDPAPPQTPEQE